MKIKIVITFFVSLCLTFIGTNLKGQTSKLFMPREIQNTYQNETRSFDGKPGKNYWQNSADYQIKAEFDPQKGILKGNEIVQYTNNSPDELKYIVVRLYQNMYKKGAIRESEIMPEDLHDGVDVKLVIINGDTLPEDKIKAGGTNIYLIPPSPIASNSITDIEIDWAFTMPKKAKIRMGTYDESSFFVALWYPQIAVYDDIAGWDRFEYTGAQEFYNDYGNFDVEITLPKDFVIWATGDLTNPNEVLSEKILKRIEKARNNPEEVHHIVTTKDIKKNIVTIQKYRNTWKYKAMNVPDFAFGTSDHYLWDAVFTPVDDRLVMINAAYNPENYNFDKVAYTAEKSMQYLSNEFPGVPYPYQHFSAFMGHFGMEFPMMSNQGDDKVHHEMVYVTTHEMTHSYFPFLVGTNERMYAWMDEGFAILLPEEIQFELDTAKNHAEFITMVYSSFAGKQQEPLLSTPTNYLAGNWYFLISYGKGEQVFRLIKRELGDDLFKQCLQEFIARWESKHPTPWDLFNTINNVSGKDLNWIYKKWFFELGVPDLAIQNVEVNDGEISFEIHKIGELPIPIVATLEFDDGSKEVFNEKMEVWKSDKNIYKIQTSFLGNKKLKKITLGDSQIPDVDFTNNVFEL